MLRTVRLCVQATQADVHCLWDTQAGVVEVDCAQDQLRMRGQRLQCQLDQAVCMLQQLLSDHEIERAQYATAAATSTDALVQAHETVSASSHTLQLSHMLHGTARTACI